MQTVKEVVQSLVDDNLVDTDKIGTSVYFWAFPSKAMAVRTAKLTETKDRVEQLKKKSKDLDVKLTEMESSREDSDERTQLLEDLAKAEAKRDTLRAEVKKYEGCDPEVLHRLESETKMAKEAVNRWTDNIYAVQSWIGKRFPSINVNDMNKQFEIPDDLDYME